jgi:predicted nucleotidyltransferase
MPDEVIESYYLETQQGLFFAVKGWEHPPDRYLAVLRYAPDPVSGSRKKGDMLYRRLYRFAEQEEFIRKTCPEYIAYDPIFRAVLQSVPRSLVRQVYDPRLRLRQKASAPLNPIDVDAGAFTKLLKEAAEVSSRAIGISGSLLIGLETDHSDLDISVFGMENCRRVHKSLGQLLESGSVPDLRRLDKKGIEDLYQERSPDARMDFSEFAAAEQNKVFQGSFRGRPYFIRFIKHAGEMEHTYGDIRYTPLGRASITARAADDRDAIFTPCRYLLEDVQTLEGLESEVSEVVSFRGRFCEQAQKGDRVEAAGTLERLVNLKEEIRYRLLLGTSPDDFLLRSHG